jgi:hypothetical protein
VEDIEAGAECLGVVFADDDIGVHFFSIFYYK